MKKLMIAAMAATAFTVFADEAKEVEKQEAPLFWGFASYGIYSGYQLYGSLLNNEPTAQGYAELNANLGFGETDLGFLGFGVWSNSDLTRRRSASKGNCAYERGIGDVFNEWDFNIHWQKTFWFDDVKTWGLTYRAYVVWYYYPGKYYQYMHPGTDTTFDFDHYFELTNPYVIPYVNIVREYRFDSNLFQFGLKKPFQITDDFSVCPFIEMVARDSHYSWCFPTRFGDTGVGDGRTNGGLATLKVELDANYQISSHFGLFAKVAYCSVIDHHMRNNCDDILASDEYGENKDFVWGGVGVSVNF